MPRLPKNDSRLIQIVDAALTSAAEKSGDWLACRPGCTQCCAGVFAINQLDAVRLQAGMRELKKASPERAAAVRARARDSLRRLEADFPGNTQTGLLDQGTEAEERFENIGNDEACPALSPEGLCEVYAHRPMTCRVFGPPVRSGEEGALAVCELCYHGATAEEIAACEMMPDPDDLESELNEEMERSTGMKGRTIVAYALLK